MKNPLSNPSAPPDPRKPTCENIVLWLHDQITAALAGVTMIEVRETGRAGCVWRLAK